MLRSTSTPTHTAPTRHPTAATSSSSTVTPTRPPPPTHSTTHGGEDDDPPARPQDRRLVAHLLPRPPHPRPLHQRGHSKQRRRTTRQQKEQHRMNIEQITAAIDEALQDLPLAERVDTINDLRATIAAHSPFQAEPVDFVQWIPNADVHANDYNPNVVAPPEMELLRLSISADGYTQPIVTMDEGDGTREVIDGFHRHRVGKECEDVQKRVQGYLPVVTIRQDRMER